MIESLYYNSSSCAWDILDLQSSQSCVLLQRRCSTPIVAHHKHRGQRWNSEFRKISSRNLVPKKYSPGSGVFFFFWNHFRLRKIFWTKNSTFEPCIFGVQLLELKCVFAGKLLKASLEIPGILNTGLLQLKDRGMKLQSIQAMEKHFQHLNI